jgi:hypothetical protein
MAEYNPETVLTLTQVKFRKNGGDQWFTVACPFHPGETDDLEHAKGRINPTEGVFTCFSCKEKSSLLGFLSAKLKQPTNIIKATIDATLSGDTAYVPQSISEDFCAQLIKNKEYLGKLKSKHGIEFESVTKYQLGFKDGETPRITIPVWDEEGKIVNMRLYSYAGGKDKMIGTKNANTNRIYLPENLKGDTIYWTEGEFKAILLNQHGFPASAPTNGAGSWEADWNERFRGKDVVIVYDVDKAGRDGAAMVCRNLYGVARSVRDVFLTDVTDVIGSNGKANGDITDYFVKKGKTSDDFRKLCLATPEYTPPAAPVEEPEDLEVYPIPLAETSAAKHNRKHVATQVVVSAKDTSPYIVPKRVRVVCDAEQKYCLHCHVSTDRGYEFDIPHDSPKILELVGCGKTKQRDVLKAISGIYPKCNAAELREIESHNVEELRVIPQIAVGHKTAEMVVRKVFYVGHGIETNAGYDITAKVCTTPESQHATLVVYDAKPAVDDINQFRLQHDLSVFQPAEWTSDAVEAKLDDIYEDLELNVTKIYRRRDLHLFYDLAFHSVLYIPFQGKLIKGWVDALCIGDSGQGKSECSSRLISHYGSGERVDTKRSSVAGLLGGLQETGGRWFIQWGTIPLNDRRLVVLEEIKGMPVESLATLTDMRSSGVAEIIKIERAKTNARTRLVWISNPRTDRRLCQYNYGVDAVKELMGSLEDIRRFDMVIAVASGGVGLDIINMSDDDRQRCAHYYTSELSRHLVMWAWSRTENQIKLEKDAEHELLAAATRMGESYSSACPIVEPSDQRLKLLRLCCALACRTYSTDDGESVVVRKCHVEVVERFLNRIYADKALGYRDYSLAQRGETSLRDPEEIKTRLKDMPNAADTVQALIEADVIVDELIANCTEWMRESAKEFIGFLVRKGALKTMRRGGYRKTGAFIELLKELDRAGLQNETLREKDSRGEL